MKRFTIALASDHAGFAYKEAIKAQLLAEGHTVRDFGTHSDASCDYPDWIRPAAEAVARLGEFVRAAATVTLLRLLARHPTTHPPTNQPPTNAR